MPVAETEIIDRTLRRSSPRPIWYARPVANGPGFVVRGSFRRSAEMLHRTGSPKKKERRSALTKVIRSTQLPTATEKRHGSVGGQRFTGDL